MTSVLQCFLCQLLLMYTTKHLLYTYYKYKVTHCTQYNITLQNYMSFIFCQAALTKYFSFFEILLRTRSTRICL